MKGRIQCPHCGKDFAAIEKDGHMKITQKCPHCGHKQPIYKRSKDKLRDRVSGSDSKDECSWEEHGEPRKTILPSFKPRTDKPMLASILLITVVIIGFSSAFLPDAYLQTPLDILSFTGSTGTITVLIEDQNGSALEDIVVWFDQSLKNSTNDSGAAILRNIPLGKQQIYVSNNPASPSGSMELFILPIHAEVLFICENDEDSVKILEESTDLVWCSSIVIILSIATIFGFIASWKRKHFDAAIVGCIVGIFTVGFYFIGSILSIAALFLLLKSKEEFDDGKKGKSF